MGKRTSGFPFSRLVFAISQTFLKSKNKKQKKNLNKKNTGPYGGFTGSYHLLQIMLKQLMHILNVNKVRQLISHPLINK